MNKLCSTTSFFNDKMLPFDPKLVKIFCYEQEKKIRLVFWLFSICVQTCRRQRELLLPIWTQLNISRIICSVGNGAFIWLLKDKLFLPKSSHSRDSDV